VSRRRLFHTHGMNKDLSCVSNSFLEVLMWKITSRGFTLQEVLIMAAANVASALIATDNSEPNDLAQPRPTRVTRI
jgi:hypothetical protein